MLRVNVKSRGCAGLAYNMEYVDKGDPFDEKISQDGNSHGIFKVY